MGTGMRQLGLETYELGAGVAPSNRSEKGPGFYYPEQSAGVARLKSIRISRTVG